jgi:hypothetical protein
VGLPLGSSRCDLLPEDLDGLDSALLSTDSTKVLLNGTPGRRICHSRGLRQGDLLSPMLFVLVMECFNVLITTRDEPELSCRWGHRLLSIIFPSMRTMWSFLSRWLSMIFFLSQSFLISLSYGPPWAHYLGGYQDRLLGGPLGLPDLRCTVPDGVKHKYYRGEVLG